ncbi:MAG: lipopolysaccharide assembly protein LapA domain-containing protein [Rhodocyclaceae bacterium]|nr:lipopolysaccharide assembly protein LapA domain-containing protein [Rhodocyclaceae bacterium]
MKAFAWFLRGLLFVLLLVLAIKNVGEVEVRFFFDHHWRAPLSLVLLVALAVGAACGLLATVPTLIRLRRRLTALEKQRAPGSSETAGMPLPPASSER